MSPAAKSGRHCGARQFEPFEVSLIREDALDVERSFRASLDTPVGALGGRKIDVLPQAIGVFNDTSTYSPSANEYPEQAFP